LFVLSANSIDDDADLFASLKQSERGGFNRSFGTGAYEDELVGADFAEQPVNPRLIKGVNASFVEDNLAVSAEQVNGEVGVVVGGEAGAIAQERIVNFLGTISSVEAVAAVVLRMNFRD
jgi:hypothetical protein